MALKTMKKAFEKSKELTFTENNVTILSALNDKSTQQVKALAEELAAGKAEDEPQETAGEEEAAGKKKYVCTICGYVYEGDELPEDFVCPLCRQGADMFELQE